MNLIFVNSFENELENLYNIYKNFYFEKLQNINQKFLISLLKKKEFQIREFIQVENIEYIEKIIRKSIFAKCDKAFSHCKKNLLYINEAKGRQKMYEEYFDILNIKNEKSIFLHKQAGLLFFDRRIMSKTLFPRHYFENYFEFLNSNIGYNH